MRIVAIVLLSGLLAGCAAGPRPDRAPRARRAERARLVVVVVYDQLAAWALARYESVLDPAGALRATAARGVQARARYPYAATVTACGHVAIYTGAPPSTSGVVANERFDRARGATVSIFDDGAHPVIGADDRAFGSPSVMVAETVADAHDRATEGAARIVSVSFKDRGAIPGGGSRGDVVLWWDISRGRFTTSAAYADAVPPWLEAWTAANPLESWLRAWEAEAPSLLARVAGPDDAPGEGDYQGLGTRFPHHLDRATDARAAIRVAPGSSEMLLALAEAAAEAAHLGEDDVPDLLAISVSGTDYAGHVFGPDSWEYVDHLVRADRAVGALLARLAERTSVSVLLTSDHGVAPLPEAMRAEGASGRIVDGDVAAAADAGIDAVLGPGTWVDAFVEPYLYLSAEAEHPARRGRAVVAAIAALDALESVHSAYDVREVVRLTQSVEPLERAVGLGLRADSDGDVFVVPAERFVFDPGMPGGAGTNHGSPWEYDRVVPVLFAGPGVAPARSDEVFDQRRVAPTISALLGTPPPSAATEPALPGAP